MATVNWVGCSAILLNRLADHTEYTATENLFVFTIMKIKLWFGNCNNCSIFEA